MTNNINLSIGVLLIGSLIWGEQHHRQKWRQARIRMCERVHVRVPIRYGRMSSTWGNTYTMVFSNEMSSPKKMGVGLAVPCVRNVQLGSDLIAEAGALWRAENIRAKGEQISANWGCVGIMFNPNLAEECFGNIKEEWATKVSEQTKSLYTCETEDIVDDCGILNIEWPETETGEPYNGADILLATPTKSSCERPSPEDIANAWKNDLKGNICYFKNNKERGIRTSEDDAIEKFFKTV